VCVRVCEPSRQRQTDHRLTACMHRTIRLIEMELVGLQEGLLVAAARGELTCRPWRLSKPLSRLHQHTKLRSRLSQAMISIARADCSWMVCEWRADGSFADARRSRKSSWQCTGGAMHLSHPDIHTAACTDCRHALSCACVCACACGVVYDISVLFFTRPPTTDKKKRTTFTIISVCVHVLVQCPGELRPQARSSPRRAQSLCRWAQPGCNIKRSSGALSL
jgi:hypothetical protein